MHGFCSQGHPEAVRRRFLHDFYGPRYRKRPNGRGVAKSTSLLTAKNTHIHPPQPASYCPAGESQRTICIASAARTRLKTELWKAPRPDPQVSPNRHGSKHTLKSSSRRPSELILRLRLGGTSFWDHLGDSPDPSRQTPGPQNMHEFCTQG